MPSGSTIIGLDLDPIKPIRGVRTFVEDITTARCRTTLKRELAGKQVRGVPQAHACVAPRPAFRAQVDVVLHDGAPNVGHAWASDAFGQVRPPALRAGPRAPTDRRLAAAVRVDLALTQACYRVPPQGRNFRHQGVPQRRLCLPHVGLPTALRQGRGHQAAVLAQLLRRDLRRVPGVRMAPQGTARGRGAAAHTPSPLPSAMWPQTSSMRASWTPSTCSPWCAASPSRRM